MSIFDEMEKEFGDEIENSIQTQNKGEVKIQRSPEWYKKRLCRITASCYDQIGFFEKKAEGKSKEAMLLWIKDQPTGSELLEELAIEKGKHYSKLTVNEIQPIYDGLSGAIELTQTAQNYLYSKINEMATGRSHFFTSQATDYGIENEPLAAAAYEKWIKENFNGLYCEQADFYECPTNRLRGGSADMLVYNNAGMIERVMESKCPFNGTNHYKNIRSGKVDKRYTKQALGHLLNTGAMFLDFVSFNPLYPTSMQFSVITLERKDVLKELAELENELNIFERFYMEEVMWCKSRFNDFVVPDFIEQILKERY